MQLAIVALVSALAAFANASTVRDLPTSATYYLTDIGQTCTFAKDQKLHCSHGRVGDAKDMPRDMVDGIILRVNRPPPPAEDPNGPGNFACLGFSW